jgi:hypothetical protein
MHARSDLRRLQSGPQLRCSLVLSVACAGALFLLLVNLNRVPKSMQPIVLIIGVLAVVLFHSLKTISLIADYYRKQRRWSVRVD